MSGRKGGVKSEKLTVKVTLGEKKAAEKLAKWLFKMGKIEKESISDCIRCCLHYTAGDVGKLIEAERLKSA